MNELGENDTRRNEWQSVAATQVVLLDTELEQKGSACERGILWGGSSGLGGSPCKRTCVRVRSVRGSGVRTEDISACV